MSKIFLSYRRNDSADATGRLADRLRSAFGKSSVFLDIEDDRKGYDFTEYIREEIANAQAIIVVIGREWAGQGQQGRRIDNPKDNVRIEIELALASQKPVIPVMVDDAVMPAKEDLPQSIAELSTRSGIELTAGSGFEGQFENLRRSIRKELSLARRIILGRAGWKAYTLISAILLGLIMTVVVAALGIRTTMQTLSASCGSQTVLLCADQSSGLIPFKYLPVQATMQAQAQTIELYQSTADLADSNMQRFIPKTCFEIEGIKQCLTHPLRAKNYQIQTSLSGPLSFLWPGNQNTPLRCEAPNDKLYEEGAKCE